MSETETREMSLPYILDPKNGQYEFYPRKHKNLDKLYQESVDSFWKAEDINLANDYNDFQKLNSDEKRVIKYIHAFFSCADGLVIENIGSNFLEEIQLREAIDFIGQQLAIETIHNKTYGNIIQVLFKKEEELIEVRKAIKNMPTIKKISQWFKKYADASLDFPIRLYSQILSEGLLFTGCFCILYWLRHYKGDIVHGIIKSNEYISRDEHSHSMFYAELYNMLEKDFRLSKEKVHEITSEAVEYSVEFINDAFNAPLVGMNADEMRKYIQFVADCYLDYTGYKKLYNTENPFPFMKLKGIQSKSNFHEVVVSEYSTNSENTIGFSDDF